MGLNMASIMTKVNAFAKSTDGMAKQQNVINTAARQNGGKLPSGKNVIDDKRLQNAASRFVNMLCTTAGSYGVPESVLKHMEDAYRGPRKFYKSGKCAVPIYFSGDMHRPAVETNDPKYQNDRGADNIVHSFNNGYHAKNYSYGFWYDHEYKPIGKHWNNFRPWDAAVYIRTRKDREGLYFIQKAIDIFNRKYGAKYNVTASIQNDIYND